MDKIKILVVDDESRMRKLVRDFLVRQDYEVLEAGDGEEALDIFYKIKGIALVILDVMMPQMDGITVLKKIREQKNPSEMRATHWRKSNDQRNQNQVYPSFHDNAFYPSFLHCCRYECHQL